MTGVVCTVCGTVLAGLDEVKPGDEVVCESCPRYDDGRDVVYEIEEDEEFGFLKTVPTTEL